MLELQNSQSSSSNPMIDQDILTQVLGERRGHNRGRGRKLQVQDQHQLQTHRHKIECIHKVKLMQCSRFKICKHNLYLTP